MSLDMYGQVLAVLMDIVVVEEDEILEDSPYFRDRMVFRQPLVKTCSLSHIHRAVPLVVFHTSKLTFLPFHRLTPYHLILTHFLLIFVHLLFPHAQITFADILLLSNTYYPFPYLHLVFQSIVYSPNAF